MRSLHLLLLTGLIMPWLGNLHPAAAQEKAKAIWSDVNDTTLPPDFKVQGEYAGSIKGGEKLGCQVIALGNGIFQAVILPGGLPGDGWDGKNKILMDGKLEGDQAAFKPASGKREYQAYPPATFSATTENPPPGQKDYTATISGETLAGTTDDGKEFELKKVIRKSSTLGAKAPEGAIVLFDGSTDEGWEATPRSGSFKAFLVDDAEGKVLYQGSVSKKSFRDAKLHVEFRAPLAPQARSQQRCNSGLYLQNRYEVQIVDSFGLEGRYDECGAVYGVQAPSVNMCLPPLSWQTYDIDFRAARYDADGKKTANARVSVVHNGVLIVNDIEIKEPTTQAAIKEDDTPGPLNLQGTWGEHVHFRNIWLVENK
jgi:hypothetical protein